MVTETPVEDPKAAFAALMSKASEVAQPEGESGAPYGLTKDGVPKKGPGGRPRKSPSLDELKAAKEAAPAAEAAPGARDESPAAPGKRKTKAEKASEPTPQHRPGIITKGVNKLYRKAGKIVQVMDPMIGTAIIESARNTADPGEPDDSVGAAWDEVARTNPRIRKFLLKVIAGGAWGSLLMAHAPILLAIMLRSGITERVPVLRFAEAFLDDGDGSPAGAPNGSPGGGLMEGLTPQDLEQAMNFAQQMMGQTAAKVADPNGTRTPPSGG